MRLGAVVVLAACGRVGFAPERTSRDASTPPPGFAYRKPLTIERANNPSGVDLFDFPLLIHLTDPDLRMASAGGKLETGVDLGFLDADGMRPLAFEIDSLSPSTGELLAWVNVPVLSATGDTSLYLTFGDREVTAGVQDRVATWAAGHAGVWHFSEASYTGAADETVDATGAHPGTPTANVTTMTGKIGRAASFAGNCANITIPQDAALQPSSVTVSAWIMPLDIGMGTDRIATIVAQDEWRAQGTGSQGYYLEVYRTISQPEPTFYAADGPNYAHAFGSGSSVANGNWYYFVGTYDAQTGTSSIYLDGALAGTDTMTGPIDYLSRPVQIGCGPSGWWSGGIDEVKISPVAHSAAWIAAEYANQVDPAEFMTVSPTEPAP